MDLYTSYWQNPDLAGLDVIPVGISRGVPRGTLAKRLPYRYKRLMDLAPRRDLFEHWIAGTIGRLDRGLPPELPPAPLCVLLMRASEYPTPPGAL
jgi:hypothetical protein